VLRNLWRDVEIPWPAITDLDGRLGLSVHTASRRYEAWAAPATRNPEVLARRRRQSWATMPTMNPQASALQARESSTSDNAAALAADPGDAVAGGAGSSANPALLLVQHAWQDRRSAAATAPAGGEGLAASAAGVAGGVGAGLAAVEAPVVTRRQDRLIVAQLVSLVAAAVAVTLG
jgi:hypothetical protein